MEGKHTAHTAGPVAHVRYVISGCGYLPGYGSHPGTGFLIGICAMGFVAGVLRDWRAGVMGAAVMLAVFGPMYLIGAHGRGRDAALAEGRG